MELIYCLLLGSVVGLISSFLGVGGGILIVPLLPSIAAVSSSGAVATSLFTVLLVAGKNVYGFQKKGLVPWAAALNIAAGASISTFVASQLLSGIDETYLIVALAVVLLAVAIRLFTQASQPPVKDEDLKTGIDIRAFVAGIFCGAIVGVTGIGGGILYGPLLLSLKMARDDQMSPGSNVVMMISSAMATVGFIVSADQIIWPKLGLVRLDLALMIFASAFLFSKVGQKYQGSIQPKLRKRIMGSLLLIMFVKTLFRI